MMRAGERNTNGRLRSDGPNETGSSRLIKGEPYIAKLLKTEGLKLTYDLTLVAPSPVCWDTLRALIKHSNLVSMGCPIREAEQLHTGERLKEWGAVVANFPPGGIKTLQDLKHAGTRAAESAYISANFLQREGERILDFVTREVSELPVESSVLCIMNSPIIETVLLELWRNSAGALQEAKPLDSIPVLDNLDCIAFGMRKGRVTETFEYRNEEKVRKAIEDELTVEKLKRAR